MKKCNNPQAVEFEFNEYNYRVEPDYENNTCEWWRVGDERDTYKCEMENPAYKVTSPDEDFQLSLELYEYLGTEDMLDQGLFLALINAAVRSFLPEDHPVRFKEVSHAFKEQLRLYRSDI